MRRRVQIWWLLLLTAGFATVYLLLVWESFMLSGEPIENPTAFHIWADRYLKPVLEPTLIPLGAFVELVTGGNVVGFPFQIAYALLIGVVPTLCVRWLMRGRGGARARELRRPVESQEEP